MVTSRWWTVVIVLAVLHTLPGYVTWAGEFCPAFTGACNRASCPWAGIYPTVLTPFCCDGSVDTVSLERQLRRELQGGVHGLLLLGTIGEGELVSPEERAQVVTTAVRVACHAAPVVVGIHSCDLDVARAQLLQAKELGADAVLVKYFGNPGASPAEVLGFYAALCDLRALPIFYYHYPSETGLKLSSADIAAILALPGVVGIKESILNLREAEAHVRLTCGQGKAYFTATALNLTQFLDLGGHGAMCPEAVLLPGPTAQAYNAHVQGRHEEARSLQKELFVLAPVVGSSSLPPALVRPVGMLAADHKVPMPMRVDRPQARLKAALNCLGVPTSAAVKPPYPSLTARDVRRVQATVCRVREIDWCEAALRVPAVPMAAARPGDDTGMLLKTGAIQLGPGVQRNLVRWQGDGKAGF